MLTQAGSVGSRLVARSWRGAAFSAAALLLACTGEVTGTGPGNPGGPGTAGGAATTGGAASGGNGPMTAVCGEPRAPLRRLTRFELNNTFRDLLAVDTKPATSLPGEELGNGFGNDADQLGVSPLLIDGLRGIAKDIAKQLTRDAATAATLAGCDLATGATCVADFVARFGLRAYRRPLAEGEATALTAVFSKGVELGKTPEKGLQAVLEVMLQSPAFLYRIEHGTTLADGKSAPTSYEMASRLSYLLWGSAPDMPLLELAAQDKLTTAEQVKAAAERLVQDSRTKDVTRFFHGQLLGTSGLDGLVRNADYYPTFEPGMGALFRQETEAFIEHVIWQGSGTFAELFTAPYTFLNGPLSKYYGFGNIPVDQTSFSKVDFTDPALLAKRSGILTQAGILSLTTPGSRTNPIVRGKWLLDKILCTAIPDPPPALMVKEPEVTPGTTARQRFAQHREQEPCKTCHQNLDPVGFGFENYDGAGLWRETDNGLPIDNQGQLTASDMAGEFHGAVEFGKKASQSQSATLCFADRWLTFAYGRHITAEDACTQKAVEDAFVASGGNVKALLVALTQTDAFLRRPSAVPAP